MGNERHTDYTMTETVKKSQRKAKKQGNGRNEADDSLFFYLKNCEGIFP